MNSDTRSSLLSAKGESETGDPNDHFRNLVVAALAAIPIVGGPFAVLVDKYIPERKQLRVLHAIEALETRLAVLGRSPAPEYVLTDEFATLFEQTLRGVANTHKDEKCRLYVEFLAKTLLDPKLASFEEKELYLAILGDLTVGQIAVLAAFRRLSSGIRNGLMVDFAGDGPRMEAQLSAETPGLIQDHVGILLSTLASVNFRPYRAILFSPNGAGAFSL